MRVLFKNYDLVVINSSGGKDSQAMLAHVVKLALQQAGDQADPAAVLAKFVVVHADLGRAEWKGTRELADEQARHYGLRFIAIARPQGDLLTHVLKRGKWPSSKQRFCTSDHKRGQVAVVINRLCRELRAERNSNARLRVLNCLGMRAEESPARNKLKQFCLERRQSNKRKTVHTWLPIHQWRVTDVWTCIKESGVRHHQAYDLGMPRLSCCFCIFSPRAALLLAGKHNPELLAEYVRVEQQIGHKFRKELPLVDIQDALACGENPGKVVDWNM